MEKQYVWEGGEKGRPLQLRRPCECGCDERDGEKGAGYLTGSDGVGGGFTIWVEDELLFQRVRDVFFLAGLPTDK